MSSVLEETLDKIYTVRYSKKRQKIKEAIWKVLCEDYLQKYVKEEDAVLDIATGHGEFINFIKCKKKYAVDVDPRVEKYLKRDVDLFIARAEKLPSKLQGKIDIVFMGCFLEHLPSKNAIIQVLQEIKRVLKNGGRLIILNPNIRFSTANFWDYFDHLIPVSDKSIVEVLKALGYQIEVVLPRFVPNTLNDRLPKSPLLVKLYLRLPFLFPLFGRQMLIVARKPV